MWGPVQIHMCPSRVHRPATVHPSLLDRLSGLLFLGDPHHWAAWPP